MSDATLTRRTRRLIGIAVMITYPIALGDRHTRVMEQGIGRKTIVLIHGLGARADRWQRNIGPLAKAAGAPCFEQSDAFNAMVLDFLAAR